MTHFCLAHHFAPELHAPSARAAAASAACWLLFLKCHQQAYLLATSRALVVSTEYIIAVSTKIHERNMDLLKLPWLRTGLEAFICQMLKASIIYG